MNKKTLTIILLLFSVFRSYSQIDQSYELPKARRFIDRFEVFVGSNLSFNNGSKFVENYKDDFIENTRNSKIGFGLGVGAYHPISNRIGMQVRLMYEAKGTDSKMTTPTLEINSKYDYRFLTLSIAPQILIGENKKFVGSLGAYLSRIQSCKGDIRVVDIQSGALFNSNFEGRQIRELRPNGSTNSLTIVPGLQSFEENEFGLIISFGYLLKISSKSELLIQLQNNFGLSSINKPIDITINPTEKNNCLYLMIGYVLSRSPKIN
jgi:hypothetical protein